MFRPVSLCAPRVHEELLLVFYAPRPDDGLLLVFYALHAAAHAALVMVE